jgi:hypothetical protein
VIRRKSRMMHNMVEARPSTQDEGNLTETVTEMAKALELLEHTKTVKRECTAQDAADSMAQSTAKTVAVTSQL